MSKYISKLKTMNRKSKLIVLLVFLECIFSFLTYKAFQSGIEHHNNEINKNNFNVKYEVDGEYQNWTGSAFPSSDDYELDLDKTSCVNKADETINNAISYANSKVTVSTNQTLYCTLYFYNAIKGYTVYHYQENIDVAEGAAQNTTNYTLKDTDNLTGRVGTNVTPEVKTYTGFTAPSKTTVTILRDGSAEVNYYYTRNSYTLTLSKGTGISDVSGAGTYDYGKSVAINATVSTGYTWSTWTKSSGTTPSTYTAGTKSQTIVMGAGNVTLTASATINSYILTANANSGSIPSTSGWSGTGETATKSVTYAAAYSTLPTPTRTGYTFAGWFTAADGGTEVSSTTTMGASNTTIYAHWVAANPTNYAYGDPKTSSPTTPPAGKNVYVGLYPGGEKAVCINRNGTQHCFKNNNYEVERAHVQEVFSDISCDVFSSGVDCDASDFDCRVNSDGSVNCIDPGTREDCAVWGAGSVYCR